MNPHYLPATAPDDVPAWQQTVVAFLAEKELRSGSPRTVENYARMPWPFLSKVGSPEQVTPAHVLAWAHGIGASGLKRQHAWGDLSDTEFQAARDATRSALAELPDGDRIRSFDAYRARVLVLPEAIEAALPARREELGRIVVQRVVVRDRRLQAIEWTPQVRPFFERQRECPQGALGTRPLSDHDSLAWYVA